MFGFGEGGGGISQPGGFIQNRLSSWRAHPFQNILSSFAGGLGGPGAGFAAQRGFDAYNNHQFGNAAQGINDQLGVQTDATSDKLWGRPLSGPLGQFQGSDGPGMTGPGGPGAGSLQGPGSYQGGYGSNMGWNMAQNWGNQSGNSTGGSSFVNDILNSLPGGSQFQTHSNPQMRRDQMESGGNTGGGFQGPMGVSQFSPGLTFIQGMRPMMGDMNGLYTARRNAPGN